VELKRMFKQLEKALDSNDMPRIKPGL